MKVNVKISRRLLLKGEKEPKKAILTKQKCMVT